MNQFAQKREIPQGEGKTVSFTRYTPLTKAAITGFLTEGANPDGQILTTASVTDTIKEWGAVINISSLLSLTAIDKNISEKVPLLAQYIAETMDWYAMAEVAINATAQVAGGKALTDIVATDVLSTTELRKAKRTLKKNKALKFEDGYLVCVVGPDGSFDLQGDTDFLDAGKYSDIVSLYRGELGKWMGFRVVEDSTPYLMGVNGVQSDSGAVANTLCFGKHAYGDIRLASGGGDSEALTGAEIIIKQSGPGDTSNALNRYSTAGVLAAYTCKTLNANWAITIKHGYTA